MAKGASLTSVATAALLLLNCNDVSALSLGRLTVQSSLGEALRAEIDVTSLSPEEAASLRTTLASPDAFRAAGVDFNPVLAGAQLSLARRPDGRAYIRVTGERSVSEPFVDVIIDFAWASGRLQRAYTLLIDPPPSRAPVAAPPAVATAPVVSPAPTQAAPLPAPVAPPPAPVARPPRPVAAKPVAPPPPAPPAAPPAAAASDSYRVRSGDTLSSIASTNRRSGVSLDQMLVSLYRGNPQAFIDSNMNRLKSGVVLNLPDAGSASEVTPEEARKVIQAHSADFAAFRQRLAGAAPTVKGTEPARQATGQVQAAVKDKKADETPAKPDKLTLSQGSAKPAVPEAKISKEAERKANDARVAELARNVEELKKLSTATKTAAPPPPPATVAAAKPAVPAVPVTPPPAPAPVVVPKPAASAPPAPAPVASVAKPAPAVVATVPSAVASTPAARPSAPAAVAAASSPVAPAAASAASASASRPDVKPLPKPAAAPEPSFLESLTNNPLVLPVSLGLVAVLAGVGIMRLRRRKQDGGAETSFIESKLQPDSFFGVSGGQRVDTRDGANSSSSLSYSLSQLDAIGDVDPVAEADVYLAYGRDLQAEEILKEALRSDPGRVAIRTKLLEVYAKRADVRGFEGQALQLQEQTGGEGEDWEKAVELGRQIDPVNPLYGGGADIPTPVMEVDIDTSSEPPPDLREDFGRSAADEVAPNETTQPFEVPAVLLDTAPADLDIDLGAPSKLAGVEPTRSLETASGGLDLGQSSQPLPLLDMDLEPAALVDGPDLLEPTLPEVEPKPAVAVPPVEFDFGELSLDLDAPKEEEATIRGGLPTDDVDDSDPLARKLELADEFRRIGDMEGARDLLEEVVSKAEGALQARAQAMLDDLD